MCKFEHKFHSGYLLLVGRLDRLRSALLGLDAELGGAQSAKSLLQARAELV